MAGVREKIMAWLDKAARKPFAYGQSDCMLEVADWLDAACGFDVAKKWRGTYSDEASLDALLDPLGGFEDAMRAEIAGLGLEVTTEPETGDVALVTLPEQDKPLGAVLMPSGRWRMKTLAGVVLTRSVTVLVAWSVPCRSS